MSSTWKICIAAVLAVVAFAWFQAANAVHLLQVADVKPLVGTATLSGRVESPKPFQAAQVYVMNVDKNILYMVYTSGDRYQAVNLFPGSYEVTIYKRGFATDAREVSLIAGARETLNFSLREATAEPVGQHARPEGGKDELQLVSFDELYPPGPGREIVQKTCAVCHGQDFLPSKQWTEAQWKAAVDAMTGASNPNRSAPVNLPRVSGVMMPPGTLSSADKENLLAYLSKNFGPHNPKRALKVPGDIPLDEEALGKAMFIEYYLPLDPKLDAKHKQRRAQNPHLDKDGNVWYTDRSIPNRVGRLDPRTGEIKDYPLPDPEAEPHGLTVDASGQVFWAERSRYNLGRLDPKTGEMTRYPMDSSGKTQGLGHSPITDSKQNVWYTVIEGGRIGKWDRNNQKTTVWTVPTQGVDPYGIAVDKNDNVWFAERLRCTIGRFDPATEKFTEYPSMSQPCTIRRLGVDSKGTVWYGVFSAGKLGKLDPKTGKMVEYKLPTDFSEPYDVWPDPFDNIWIGDGGQGGALIKFEPHTEKFTYYPTAQRTDLPKLAITRDGAVWYCPRSSSKAAVGVLYPDISKITTMAAYP